MGEQLRFPFARLVGLSAAETEVTILKKYLNRSKMNLCQEKNINLGE